LPYEFLFIYFYFYLFLLPPFRQLSFLAKKPELRIPGPVFSNMPIVRRAAYREFSFCP